MVRPEILKNKRKEGKQNPSHQSQIFQNFLVFVRTFQPRRHSPLKFQFATRTYKPHTLIFLSSKGNDNSLFLSLSPSFLNRNEIVSLGSLQREAEREREREKEILRYVRISGPSLTFEHEIKSTVIFRENLLVFFLPLPATLSPYSQR